MVAAPEKRVCSGNIRANSSSSNLTSFTQLLVATFNELQIVSKQQKLNKVC
jgi:hypothetical protein